MEGANSGGNKAAKRRTEFGLKAVQTSENDDVSSRLVGNIVEKGISGNLPLSPPPKPTVLPFPVARHRSHGPHWAPLTTDNSGQDDDSTEDEDVMAFETVASFAEPIRRKEKKGLEFSRWRELIANDNNNAPHKKNEEKYVGSKDQKKTKLTQNLKEIKSSVSNSNGTLQERTMSFGETLIAQDVIMNEKEYAISEKWSTNISEEIKEEIMGEVEVGLLENRQENGNNSTSLEGQIDIENRARLETMSADEIAEAQAEILQRMKPALVEALRKRGRKKLNLPIDSIIAESGNGSQQDTDKIMRNENGHFKPNGDNYHKIKGETLKGTNGEVNLSPVEESVISDRSSSWDIWSEKVEAAREIRFSLDGNIVYNESPEVQTGYNSTNIGFSTENVSERDFLRTEGDPAAAGYTIKEAIALTRSVIPSQRALALHLLASVLDKAIHNCCQNQIDQNVKSDSNKFIHWGAVWAYALGPEPELALSLRMSLDDNHNSVVLASVKVIQCILCCEVNESYFDISEKLTTYPRDINTAPVFRSRPDIHDGFLQGGFWKYSAKPSNIFSFGEDNIIDNAEGEHTIQDDMIVAGQDFVAGLVRMGVLQRICYLLESDPSLEEGLISILIAIARHSPTCANAIMKCERLLQTIIDRFTTNEPLEIRPSKIKSVTLLKVLARSEKKNCIDLIRNGVFQSTTWHLYQYKFSLDQWVNLGSGKCKLFSALLIEQLRFWKVCIQYGYCISKFSDLFPSLCLWLNVPSMGKLIENNILNEFAAVTEEIFLVLGAMSRTLANMYSNIHSPKQMPGVSDENKETWYWGDVGTMVDFATKWLALLSNNYKIKISEKPILHVISAVMLMLCGVLDRVIPEDINSFPGGHLPWLSEFVPKIGLEIIKNGYLSYSKTNDREQKNDRSFVEHLCLLRQQSDCEMSIASSCCLSGLLKMMVSIDKLIEMAKWEASVPSSTGEIMREGLILKGGMVKFCIVELRSILNTFMNLISCEWKLTQSIEVFGRGGPAPGVGVGWGAVGGGFWSKNVLLAQADIGLIIPLLELFQPDIFSNEEMAFTVQKIVTALGVCMILGPRDGIIMENILEHLLQVHVLKFFDCCIRNFMSCNEISEPFKWNYKDDDFRLFSETLTSHFKKRWLSVKEKKNKHKKVINENKHSLETIDEDLETSNVTDTTLSVEWANQRLPLPTHWYLSPISYSDTKNQGHADDFVEVAKSGIFFILGIEIMTLFLPTNIPSVVRSVSLAWKLHSLSVSLLSGMALLEDEKTRDIFKTLQRVYGKLLDESLLSIQKNSIMDEKEKLLAGNGGKNSIEILSFEKEIHDSYPTFVENLVEQFAAESYGDEIFARQIAVYLHRCVDTPVRLAAWNNLSTARVLELLPFLENCIGEAEGYLEPAEDDDSILEAYVKSWVSGALDRARTRKSMTYTLVLHHLSSFIFSLSTDVKITLRNKLITSLLRDYSWYEKHKGMMLDLIQYHKDGKTQESSTKPFNEERLVLLAEACQGNSSLLHDLEKLKSSFQNNNLRC